MRAPDFWYPQKQDAQDSLWSSVAPWLLTPVASVYELLGQARQKFTAAHEAPVPVVCIGNLTAGGTGKTPVAIALGTALKEAGRVPYFLTRGYGGRADGPLLVELELHDCHEVGDEALMLASHCPTAIAKDRADGAALATKLGADIIVMDDGFQNPSLKKDFSILIVDGDLAFGNGHIIPAGPLRENAESGLKRANQIIVTRKNGAASQADVRDLVGNQNVINIRLDCPNTDQGQGRKAIAFAGIAQPEKFFAAVRAQGFEIVGTQSFADHHNYDEDDLKSLTDWARERQATLVTTEKDAYRLTPELRAEVEIIPLRVVFENDDDFNQLIVSLQGAQADQEPDSTGASGNKDEPA